MTTTRSSTGHSKPRVFPTVSTDPAIKRRATTKRATPKVAKPGVTAAKNMKAITAHLTEKVDKIAKETTLEADELVRASKPKQAKPVKSAKSAKPAKKEKVSEGKVKKPQPRAKKVTKKPASSTAKAAATAAAVEAS